MNVSRELDELLDRAANNPTALLKFTSHGFDEKMSLGHPGVFRLGAHLL